MRFTPSSIAFAAACLLSATTFAAPIPFVADDGRGNINTGTAPYDDVDVVWGNYFTTAEPDLEIAKVSVAFARVAEGVPVTVFVLDDPDNDGDPGNATLVGFGEGLTANANANNAGSLDQFVDYAITDHVDTGNVNGGFFVGVIIRGLDALNPRPGQNGLKDAPARRDTDTADGAGWFFYGPGNETDLNDLGGLPVGVNVGEPTIFGGLAGNNLIRATSVPEPAGIGALTLGLGCLLRRRRA